MKKKKSLFLKATLPLMIFFLLSPLTPWIDLKIAALFYDSKTGFYDNCLFRFLFRYGELFGFICGAMVALSLMMALLKPEWKQWRKGAFAILITLILGAGIFTNTLLKGYWGRPRPKQVTEFGGTALFCPVYRPHVQSKTNPQKSFPSGHVAMGFSFLAYCFSGKRLKNKCLFYFGGLCTLLLGGGLMIVRVAQGGHFFSDVVFSFVLMWFVTVIVDEFTWAGDEKQDFFVKTDGISPKSDGSL